MPIGVVNTPRHRYRDRRVKDEERESKRESAAITLMKRTDSLIRVWADSIPRTLPSMLVWEYRLDTGDYHPYRWERPIRRRDEATGEMVTVRTDHYALPEGIDPLRVQMMLDNVKEYVLPPPRANYCQLTTLYFVLIHLPCLYYLTRYYFYANIGDENNPERDSEVSWVSIKFFTLIVMMTLLMVGIYIYLERGHNRILQGREYRIQRILDTYNREYFKCKGMVMVCGQLGGWIEGHVLDGSALIDPLTGTKLRQSGQVINEGYKQSIIE